MSSPDIRSAEMSRRQYSFGEFTLDLDRGVLRRGTEEAPLRPKSFEVLTYLVQRHGQLVSKSALMDAVWADTAIGDNSLAQCLLDIRRALGDESQQLIRTVARRGYIFTPPVATPVVEFPRECGPAAVQAPPPRANRKNVIGAIVLTSIALILMFMPRARRPDRHVAYEQITSFTDSAVTPALSPDGKMVAFIRSPNWWLTRGEIYVKLLPNGEPVQITHDPRAKYGLAFSPDGSRISYTVRDRDWATYTVSPLGGEAAKLLSNAAGLTWLDDRRVLLSEIKTGAHMGVVTAMENRSDYRSIYFPRDERGMVHLSYASPDRKWALAVEMDPVWLPCRVIPLDGSSEGRQAGPKGKCTSAAWSPDGKWMYLGVEVDGQPHLWRQRFPSGEPEQITFGPTEEAGVAVAPDGLSLITSIGLRQGEVWIHDAHGDRRLSLEGHVPQHSESGRFATDPTFSRDGKSVFYLRRQSPGAPFELWRVDLESGKSVKVLPGFSILEYDISLNGADVVFSTQTPGQALQIWLAPLDLSRTPHLVSSASGDSPHFGPEDGILFRMHENNTHYLARMNRDGSGRSRVASYPIGNVQYISPDRRWITTFSPVPDGRITTLVVPTAGGAPRIICGRCGAPSAPSLWGPDGKFFYTPYRGKLVAIPIPAGETLPNLPPSGINGPEDLAAFPGSRVIEAGSIIPGPDPSVYAYVKTTVQRNLFRIPLHQ